MILAHAMSRCVRHEDAWMGPMKSLAGFMRNVCVIQKDVTKQRVQQHYRIFEEALKPYEPYLMIQPGRTRTRSRIVIILQLDTNTWSMKQQDAKLAIFLGSLDRDCTVQFDPYHLF